MSLRNWPNATGGNNATYSSSSFLFFFAAAASSAVFQEKRVKINVDDPGGESLNG